MWLRGYHNNPSKRKTFPSSKSEHDKFEMDSIYILYSQNEMKNEKRKSDSEKSGSQK